MLLVQEGVSEVVEHDHRVFCHVVLRASGAESSRAYGASIQYHGAPRETDGRGRTDWIESQSMPGGEKMPMKRAVEHGIASVFRASLVGAE